MVWNIPNVSFMLGVIVYVGYMLYAGRKGQLDLADFFKDEEKRSSAGRAIAIGTWLASTWLIMSYGWTEKDGLNASALFGYMAINIGPYLGGKTLDVVAMYAKGK